VLRALNDLERHALIRRARYTRQVALDLRIEFQPVRVVLLLLLARGWQIRDLAAFDDTESGRHSSSSPELAHRTHARWMRLDVPVRRVHGLPDAVQIRFAIWRPRRTIRR